MPLSTRYFKPDNGEGWELDVACHVDPEHFDADRPPVVLVPGYGMNTFVLGFHPEGLSLIEYLAAQGFEVWAANLRGQGASRRLRGRRRIGFRELALVDLARVWDLVLDETKTRATTAHAIGCSLGATLLYAWLAHNRHDHPLASMVALGGPLRWDRVHPLLRAAFASPALVGQVRVRGTRRMARAVLPLAKRFPGLLSIYMNASIIDLSKADELVKTVEDPHPHLNRQIAHWVNKRDLEVEGVVVTEALRGMDLDVLVVLANADGIVPPEAALSVRDPLGEDRVDVLEVGDDDEWFAHADLFVSRNAQTKVFAPIASWLREREADAAPLKAVPGP